MKGRILGIRASLAATAVVTAVALGGCGGGGGDHTGSTAASAGSTAPSTTASQSAQSNAAANSTPPPSSKDSFTLGSPADVPRSKGGDNSIQDFGSEAAESDRAAAGRALAAYLQALAKGNTEQACGMLSSATQDRIEQTLKQLSAQGAGGEIPTSCAQLLALTSHADPTQLRVTEVLSFRSQDDSGFLIYRAGDRRIYTVAMQGGAAGWKVAAAGPSPLGA